MKYNKLMKSVLIALIILLALETSFQTKTSLAITNPTQDSEELRLQDMLMSMLTPYIEKDLRNYYYPNIIKDFSPIVAPWMIEVKETRRLNGFRGFKLQITFEIEPTDGGQWIPIGKDRMTYEITSGPTVKLINHTHLKTYKYPPDLQDS